MRDSLREEARGLVDELDEGRLAEALPHLRRLKAGSGSSGGFLALVGLTSVSQGDGRCTMECEPALYLMNPHGVLHGGVLFAAMDTAMGGAVTSVLAEDEVCATIEAKINYLSPVTEGKLTATATVVQKGGRIAVAEARATGDSGRLAAVMTGTFIVQRRAASGNGD